MKTINCLVSHVNLTTRFVIALLCLTVLAILCREELAYDYEVDE